MAQDSPPPSQNNNSTAKGMVWLAWIAGLIFFTYLFQQVLEDRYNPNQALDENRKPGQVHEVVLQRNAQGHYVADGLINRSRAIFLLDTGATVVAIPAALAEQLKLPKERGSFSQTANGSVAVWETTLNSVQLGSIRLHNVRATILPSMQKGDPVLLGMSFLKQLELEQRNGELTLRQGRIAG